MQNTLIEARGLAKAYPHRLLFQGVDLSIERGASIAFLGHNGSGKTTLLKILSGLVNQSAGTVTRAGGLRMGYVPENFPRLNLTARQYCRHMGRVEGLSRTAADTGLAALSEAFFLEGMLDIPMRHLSKGTLQKIGVVQALLGPRDVLLLDEPLSGQDIPSQRAFIDMVKKRGEEGCAVLLSCHEPHLVRAISDRAYRIERASLAALDSLDGLDAGPAALAVLVFAWPEGAPPPALPDGTRVERRGARLFVTLPAEKSNAFIVKMIGEGYRLEEMRYGEDA